MLGNQLLSRPEVPRLVARRALLFCHQHVEKVVDYDRHLDAINRGELPPILRRPSVRLSPRSIDFFASGLAVARCGW